MFGTGANAPDLLHATGFNAPDPVAAVRFPGGRTLLLVGAMVPMQPRSCPCL